MLDFEADEKVLIEAVQLAVRVLRAATATWIAHHEDERFELIAEAWLHEGFDAPQSERIAFDRTRLAISAGLHPFSPRVILSEVGPAGDGSFDETGHLLTCGLYEAIAAETYNDMVERPVYRRCKNDRCRRRFAHQRTNSVRRNTRSDTLYCSTPCSKAQAERDRRQRIRAAKQRRQGGQDD